MRPSDPRRLKRAAGPRGPGGKRDRTAPPHRINAVVLEPVLGKQPAKARTGAESGQAGGQCKIGAGQVDEATGLAAAIDLDVRAQGDREAAAATPGDTVLAAVRSRSLPDSSAPRTPNSSSSIIP